MDVYGNDCGNEVVHELHEFEAVLGFLKALRG